LPDDSYDQIQAHYSEDDSDADGSSSDMGDEPRTLVQYASAPLGTFQASTRPRFDEPVWDFPRLFPRFWTYGMDVVFLKLSLFPISKISNTILSNLWKYTDGSCVRTTTQMYERMKTLKGYYGNANLVAYFNLALTLPRDNFAVLGFKLQTLRSDSKWNACFKNNNEV